ncbi:MAG: hypothetical protein U0T02_08825 [Solirubrobacteraceae bacterium]
MAIKSRQEREQERREERQEQIRQQVDDGSLVIRQMTDAERKRYERKRSGKPGRQARAKKR